MRMIPHEYNGFLFQDTTNHVTATFPEDNPNDWNILGIASSEIARSQNFPDRGSKDYAGQIKIITVNMNDIDESRDRLVIAMDVLGSDQHRLIAHDEFGRAWYVMADAINLSQGNIEANVGAFSYALKVNDPIWRRIDEDGEPAGYATVDVSESGSVDITPYGNQLALPVITITPIAGSSGFLYQRFVQIINNATLPLVNYPVNLTGAGLDTAALVADNSNKALVNVGGGINASVTTIPYDTVTGTIASSGLIYIGTEQISYTGKTLTNFTGCVRGVNGTVAATHADNSVIFVSKMAADGNDLRVYVDGAEVKRWLSGMNTTTTKIWINQSQPANSNMTLGTAIAGAGDIATISIANTADNNAKLALIPTSGNVLIGSEVFTYTGVSISSRLLTGVTRASRQTSAGAHAVADTIKFVTHDIYIYYGSPNISAYVVDDTYKPCIALTSTNTSHVYEVFGNQAQTRTAGWFYYLLQAVVSFFTGTGAQQGVDPFTAMGLQNAPSVNGLGIIGSGIWKIVNPCGVSTITVTGKKFRTNVAYWDTMTFETSLNDSLWVTQWTETSPAVLTLADLDTHTAVALGATYPYLRFRIQKLLTNTGNSNMEIRGITAVPVNVPTVTVASELSIVELNTTLTNAANGLSMQLILVMTSAQVITVDTKNKTIYLADGTNVINALQDFPVRPNWLPLEPGETNTISIVDAGHSTYEFAYEDGTL